jgi:hypothetical protein
MSLNNTKIHFLEKHRGMGDFAKTGVSLHCHTLHSKETLDFIPYYAEQIPIVSRIWKRECRRYYEREGKMPNFNTGYWEPPLTGGEVFGMESAQINKAGLNAIVSITDHDCIQANLDLNREIDNSHAPISMEWTVPFGCAYFHLGVHNLPTGRADEITRLLLDYTRAKGEPDNERLNDLFAFLNEIPSVLVVLNHPVWDIEMIGQTEHNALLESFVAEHSRWIHAIELNGFRPWSENKGAIELAERLNLPLVSGGDRHCLHSNTILNVTNAESFAEFASEIREDKFSSIVVMPEYHEPLVSRQISSMAQILGHYPNFPEGRRTWSDRIYFDANDGTGVRSLTSCWSGSGPKLYGLAIHLLSVLGHRGLHPIFRLASDPSDVAPRESKTREKPGIAGSRLVEDH